MRYVIVGLLALLLLAPSTVQANKSYEAPTLSTIPRDPDVRGYEGATLHFSPWTLTVPPDTFSYDVYFRHGCGDRSRDRRIGRYWQVSKICDFHPLSHFNRAKAVSQRSWVITFTYTDEDIEFLPGFHLPENSLKIVYSPDYGKSWEMLRSSTVDVENNTVAAITNRPGGYMLMGGFVSPETYFSYSEVQGAATSNTLLDKIVAVIRSLL